MKYKTKTETVEVFKKGIDEVPDWFLQEKKEKGLIAFDNNYVVKHMNGLIEVLTEEDFYNKYELKSGE